MRTVSCISSSGVPINPQAIRTSAPFNHHTPTCTVARTPLACDIDGLVTTGW